MAGKKKEEKKYTVLVPKGGKEEDTHQFVSVNGKTYRIKKGVPVQVPKEVARVIGQRVLAEEEKEKFEEEKTAKKPLDN